MGPILGPIIGPKIGPILGSILGPKDQFGGIKDQFSGDQVFGLKMHSKTFKVLCATKYLMSNMLR